MFKPRTRGKRISVYDALAGKNKCLKKSMNSRSDQDLQNNASEQAKKQKTETYESRTEYDDEIDRQFLYRMLTMNDD